MAYFDLGKAKFPITTPSKKAQKWFNRGLLWVYGFNHEEAIACFQRALDHDRDCAMAHWGIAYAVGPNYNRPWELFDPKWRAEALAQAFDATQTAQGLAEGAQLWEQALIAALAKRYPQRDPAPDMEPWNHDFADAMERVQGDLPDNLEVRGVFAEALLNLTPWQMWDLRTGKPAEGARTADCQRVLEQAFESDPRAMTHPGLLHLYVHLMEMSPTPERALKAGDVLRDLMPDAGHLIHMPTHIDVLCGHYRDVVHWNRKAIEADRKYLARAGVYNIYTGYRIHNFHFVIYGAMFLGQFAPAIEAVRGIRDSVPDEFLQIKSPPMADFFESYLGFEPHVLVRFGKWDEAAGLPLPDDQDLFCTLTANVHYARGVAWAALGQVDKAKAEQALFAQAKARIPETRRLHNNRVVDVLEIADAMLAGEIAYREGNFNRAFADLRRAVQTEDDMPYDEPWGWMQPSRHALGALLFEQGRVDEAEEVYREDLGLGGHLSRATVHPDNVWALKGLHDCLKARGETEEIVQIAQRLELANARADRAVAASCFCAQAAMA